MQIITWLLLFSFFAFLTACAGITDEIISWLRLWLFVCNFYLTGTSSSCAQNIRLSPNGQSATEWILIWMLPVIQLKTEKTSGIDACQWLTLPDASSFHTIAGTSIAGNLCLFRNEQSATGWIQLCWLHMHKQGLFTPLLHPWCASETQKSQFTPKDTLFQHEVCWGNVCNQRQSSQQPPIIKDSYVSAFR